MSPVKKIQSSLDKGLVIRLNEALEKSGLNRNKVREKLIENGINVARTTLYGWFDGRWSPKPHHLQVLANVLNVTPEWLQFDVSFDDGATLPIKSIDFATIDLDAERLPFYEVDQFAKGIDLKRDWIEREISEKSLDQNNFGILCASGNSMLPTICDGDILLIIKEQSSPKPDSVYIIETAGVIYIRRLQNTPVGLLFTSDNPAYQSFPIKAEEAKVIGRVAHRWHGESV